MLTIEHEDNYQSTTIVAIDPTGSCEDIEVNLPLREGEDCFIRQFDEDLEINNVIQITYDQFQMIAKALDLSEGTYVQKKTVGPHIKLKELKW